jgi:hypothetical protein
LTRPQNFAAEAWRGNAKRYGWIWDQFRPWAERLLRSGILDPGRRLGNVAATIEWGSSLSDESRRVLWYPPGSQYAVTSCHLRALDWIRFGDPGACEVTTELSSPEYYSPDPRPRLRPVTGHPQWDGEIFGILAEDAEYLRGLISELAG